MTIHPLFSTTHTTLKRMVPGVITGGADNDPASILTYALAGAMTGFSQLWLMIIATPILISVQGTAARLADTTKKGLTTLLKLHFPKQIVWAVLLVFLLGNLFLVGATFALMKDALELLFPNANPWFLMLLSAVFLWYLVVFQNYRHLAGFLFFMVIFFFCYLAAAFLSHPDWKTIFQQIIFPPLKLDKIYLQSAIALLGATIMPYLLFWQTEEEIQGKPSLQLRLRRVFQEDFNLAPGMIYSQIITLAIIIAVATTLYPQSRAFTLAEIASSLEPVAGSSAKILFALGGLASGFLALPIMISVTATIVAEFFGFREGLSLKPKNAKEFYIVLSFTFIIGVIIAFSGFNPITALFYTQIFNGLLAPVFLLFLLILANKKALMGPFVNRRWDNFWLFLGFMFTLVSSVLFLFSLL